MTATIDKTGWPTHQPVAYDVPIAGQHWYAGCNPDGGLVNPETGRCDECGQTACVTCGRGSCRDCTVVEVAA